LKKKEDGIKGLFFKDYKESLEQIIRNSFKDLKLDEAKIMENMPKILEKMVDTYEDTTTSFYLEKHKFDIENYIEVSNRNRANIIQKNRESFISFYLYINLCVTVYEDIIQFLRNNQVPEPVKISLILYGNIIRRSQEVSTLLSNGFIDGAMIIWRSLYENIVTLLFLAENDSDDLTNAFVDHSHMNARKRFRNYKLNYEELNFSPPPKETEEFLSKETERLKQKYGTNFLKNSFGWADQILGKRVNFRDLEDYLKLNKFRPFYTLCSEQIHSSFSSIDRYREQNKIMIERFLNQEYASYSFVDIMQFTGGVLHEVNDYILWEFSIDEELSANITFESKIFEKLLLSLKKDNATDSNKQQS